MMNKRTLLLALTASTLSFAGITYAKSEVRNHEIVTLLDFNKEVSTDSTVKRKEVTFMNNSLKMAGVIYMPSDLDEGKKYPAIVVIHPGGGIKEQTASLYAYRLAKQGFIALAFDASHQGASEGEPRLLENPTERVEDARSAVDYLTTLSTVDRNRIGALGICAGGGYAISAAITEKRIKAVASVSGVDIGEGFRKGWTGKGTVAEQLATLKSVSEKRTESANGKEAMLISYVPDVVDNNTEPDLADASVYYRTPARWQHANSPNRFLFSSVDKLYAYSAFDRIETLLTQPILLIAGSNAGSRWHSERAYKLARGPKELFIVKGGTHMSLYDKDVMKAVPKLTAFFNKNLSAH